MTCIYKNYILSISKTPQKNIFFLLLLIFSQKHKALYFSHKTLLLPKQRALFHTLTVSSYSRDAAVPAVPAKTIKPFDPHRDWLVPGFHPDTASVAR